MRRHVGLLAIAMVLAANLMALTAPEPVDEAQKKQVIAWVKNLKGTYTTDDNVKGKPIVGIVLAKTKITDSDLEALRGLKTLRSLDLTSTELTNLQQLDGLTGLRSLKLMFTSVTDDGLAPVSRMENLRELDLGCTTTFTDAGLAQLKGLKYLEKLVLRNTKLTDRCMAHLRKESLPSLKDLDLTGTKITDSGLSYLRSMPQLERLQLRYCSGVTDEGVKYLKDLEKAKYLDLAETKFSIDAVRNLQLAMKNTAIIGPSLHISESPSRP